jgi:hypothetical protein
MAAKERKEHKKLTMVENIERRIGRMDIRLRHKARMISVAVERGWCILFFDTVFGEG